MFRFVVIIIPVVTFIFYSRASLYQNKLTDWSRSRQKRFLQFPFSGVQKYVLSANLPVDLYDKRKWRSLSGLWNFQWQHTLPPNGTQWWNSTYFPVRNRKRSLDNLKPSVLPEFPVDLTATFLYAMIENFMNRKGSNGRECLKRAICENSQVTHVQGVLDRIYRRLLTPEKSMEAHYHDAYKAGVQGVDCQSTFYQCAKDTIREPNHSTDVFVYDNNFDGICTFSALYLINWINPVM